MKFKGILTEAFIDTLKLTKVEKHLLNKMYQEEVENLKGSHKFADYIINKSKELVVSEDIIVKMYLTYIKYKDILFSERGIATVDTYDTFSNELKEITRRKILETIYKNYNETEVFNSEGVTCTIYFNEGLEVAIEEGMNPEFYVKMPVTGPYSGVIRGGKKQGEAYTVDDATFFGTIFLDIFPNSNSNFGYDFINFADDTFGDWLYRLKGKKVGLDIVESGRVKSSAIPTPKNYSESELKKYVDKWVEMCGRIVKKNLPLLHEYKDFVEHDGIFEGYNRKQKLKK